MNSRHAVRLLISRAAHDSGRDFGFRGRQLRYSRRRAFQSAKTAAHRRFFPRRDRQGKIPGAILLIQQHGKPVYHEFFGVRDVATRLPMTDDTIFRLYSMTKPITSVAAMMLIDEGKLRLDDPVAKYIPSFAKAKVGRRKEGGQWRESARTGAGEPADHDSGPDEPYLGHRLWLLWRRHGPQAYAAADIYEGDFDNAEFAERIARLPLAVQPGTLWEYGHSTDILGRVIEVVSGKSLLAIEKSSCWVRSA